MSEWGSSIFLIVNCKLIVNYGSQLSLVFSAYSGIYSGDGVCRSPRDDTHLTMRDTVLCIKFCTIQTPEKYYFISRRFQEGCHDKPNANNALF